MTLKQTSDWEFLVSSVRREHRFESSEFITSHFTRFRHSDHVARKRTCVFQQNASANYVSASDPVFVGLIECPPSACWQGFPESPWEQTHALCSRRVVTSFRSVRRSSAEHVIAAPAAPSSRPRGRQTPLFVGTAQWNWFHLIFMRKKFFGDS